MGASPPSSSSSSEPIIARRKVLRSFSGAETAAGEDDEAAGLTPGSKEPGSSDYFSPEKPCLPLSTEGTLSVASAAPSVQQAPFDIWKFSPQLFRYRGETPRRERGGAGGALGGRPGRGSLHALRHAEQRLLGQVEAGLDGSSLLVVFSFLPEDKGNCGKTQPEECHYSGAESRRQAPVSAPV